MREIVWDFPMGPMERTLWWVGSAADVTTGIVELLKEAKNLQEAMVEVVEVLHSNLQADPDLSGLYDPLGTLN